MSFGDAQQLGIDLEMLFAQELNGLALAPRPVDVIAPPANVLVNRVPEGYTPILIDLQRCSRSELRRFLHKHFCSLQPGAGNGGEGLRERPLGRCACELLEFDYQPDFLFNKPKHEGQAYNNMDNDFEYSDDADDDDDDNDDDNDNDNTGESNIDDGDGLEFESNSTTGTLICQEDEEAEHKKIKIKRPPNPFIIYRSQRHNELVKLYKGGNKVISKMIAAEWHSFSPEEKKKYEDQAAVKKHEHEQLYPNYKFMPKRRKL